MWSSRIAGTLDQAWGKLGPHVGDKKVEIRNTCVRRDARQDVPCLNPKGTCLNRLERNLLGMANMNPI